VVAELDGRGGVGRALVEEATGLATELELGGFGRRRSQVGGRRQSRSWAGGRRRVLRGGRGTCDGPAGQTATERRRWDLRWSRAGGRREVATAVTGLAQAEE